MESTAGDPHSCKHQLTTASSNIGGNGCGSGTDRFQLSQKGDEDRPKEKRHGQKATVYTGQRRHRHATPRNVFCRLVARSINTTSSSFKMPFLQGTRKGAWKKRVK